MTSAARIRVPAVDSRIVTRDGRKIGYIALAQFSRGAADAVRDTVTALRERGARPRARPARRPGRAGQRGRRHRRRVPPEGLAGRRDPGPALGQDVLRTDTDPVAGDLPLEVLVNRSSASASEIVAGALRDTERGTLVGERTFGKALVQSTILLRNGGALKLTTQRYLTPSGYDLAKRGLPPAVRAVDDPDTRARRGPAEGPRPGGAAG